MKYTSLAKVERCYGVASTASLSWRLVEHPTLEAFAEGVFELTRLARRAEDDTGWRQFLYPARRARNIATTVPLPFRQRELGLRPLLDQLKHNLAPLRVYGGEDAGALGAKVLEAGHDLTQLEDAPLLDAVLDLTPTDNQLPTGLVLPIPEFVGVVNHYLKAQRDRSDIAVLSRHDVADLDPLERLVIIGPLYWYENHQYVLTSPRAEHMVVLKWAWYREREPQATALEGSRGGVAVRVKPLPPSRRTFTVTADEERTSIDWKSVSHELTHGTDDEGWAVVTARAAVLAGRRAVLLPEDGDRLVWLLDPQAPPEHRVARVDVADLDPGHVIVLRTSGGGDLIVPLADELLGDEAPRLRELQALWKQQLRVWVRRQGSIRRAAMELRKRGCRRANPQNLQNWLSERSLRTEDRKDWQVLMEAGGLSARAAETWSAMNQLNSAHTEAGMTIGRRLREMANTQPLNELLATGMQAFRLPRGGSLTAFRIEGFSPTPVECSPNRLMVPTRVPDEWLT